MENNKKKTIVSIVYRDSMSYSLNFSHGSLLKSALMSDTKIAAHSLPAVKTCKTC